jgi:hypothetical protein
LKTTTCSGGSFGQTSSSNVDIAIPSPHDLGLFNISLKGKTSNRFGVDIFQVRQPNPIDLYMYDQWDNSTWSLNPGTENPIWDNPSIQLYEGAAPVASNNLVVGHTYRVVAQVYNATSYAASKAKVTFKFANFGLGQPPDAWTVISPSPVEINVPASGSAPAEVNWTPAITGHMCVQVEIYHIEEINTDNNFGQENCHVGPTSSPAKVEFTIWNPTKEPRMIYMELRQLKDSVSSGNPVLWGSEIIHPDPQLLKPGDQKQATVVIDPGKADISRKATVTYSLTGYANGKIIGGAQFRITKK